MTPEVAAASVPAMVLERYGLTARCHRLPGENANYEIQTGQARFVLKIAGDGLDDSAELEQAVVAQIVGSLPGLSLPNLVPDCDGQLATTFDSEGGTYSARLLEFVEGQAWLDAGSPSEALQRSFGEFLARLTASLEGFDHRGAHRTHHWDLARAAQHRGLVANIVDPDDARVVEHAFQQFAAAQPRLAAFRHSVIHGDVNHENVLVTAGKVTGLLDFGDCLWNPTICELAIALAYMMMDVDDPVGLAINVVLAYDAKRPLDDDELAVLFSLICGRLCVTICTAAWRRTIDPNHPTWFATEKPAWKLLKKLAAVTPLAFENRLREAIDRPVHDTGATREELTNRRRKRISAALSVAYDEPIKMIRGQGQYLIDDRGRPFLDMVNNVCHVGHCHPHVVAAGQRQMAILNTNSRYLYDGLTDYADRLSATLPAALEVCFLVNSGSEANELALRLASLHTGNRDFVVVDGAYHGHSSRLIEASPYKFMGRGGTGVAADWVHVVPIADGYRGEFKGQGPAAGVAYGNEVGKIVQQLGRPIAGFLSESLLSCGGQVIPPADYFKTAYRHVRAAGGVCIADEVQVGFGRVGTHFWAFEQQGVIPDIVVMGKPIGNGHPLSAVVTTRAIADSFENGMEFFSTFGGNPVSCAIGQAVLDVMENEQLQEHALNVGNRLRDGLAALMKRHKLIGDVRGTGLFVGMELVRDRETLEPADREAEALVNRLRQQGILLSVDGPLHNVIKIKPPMVLTADDVDMVVRSIDRELLRWA